MTYMTLIKHTIHETFAEKLLVGDVIATAGTVAEPMRLRRIDSVDRENELVLLTLSTPKTGKDSERESIDYDEVVVVVGRVEPQKPAASTQKPKAGTPKQTATAAKATPKASPAKSGAEKAAEGVKVIKVDATVPSRPVSRRPCRARLSPTSWQRS